MLNERKIQKLKKLIRMEVKKILKEDSTSAKNWSFDDLKSNLIRVVKTRYDWPLKISIIEDETMHKSSNIKTVKSAEELCTLVVKIIKKYYNSVEEFVEQWESWQDSVQSIKQLANDMHYESVDGMVIGIDENYAIGLDVYGEDDDDEDY